MDRNEEQKLFSAHTHKTGHFPFINIPLTLETWADSAGLQAFSYVTALTTIY